MRRRRQTAAAGTAGRPVIAGTVPYMPPELLEGKEVDARGDIFSFGAVVYEMVTGRKAFDGDDRSSLVAAISSAPYPSGTLAPRSLDAIVEICLAKDPDHRWSNMHDVRLQLQAILQHDRAGGRAPGLPMNRVPAGLASRRAVGERGGLRPRVGAGPCRLVARRGDARGLHPAAQRRPRCGGRWL